MAITRLNIWGSWAAYLGFAPKFSAVSLAGACLELSVSEASMAVSGDQATTDLSVDDASMAVTSECV